MADGAFPAHLFFKSNLYGDLHVGEQRISKGTVINFFIDRVFAGEPLTVYEPGIQARNYIHVDDVARVSVPSVERLLTDRADGVTGVTRFEVASDEDPSVMRVAELVQSIAAEEAGREPEITLVANPRRNETLVEEFAVDTSRTRAQLGWEPTHTIEESVRRLVSRRATATAE